MQDGALPGMAPPAIPVYCHFERSLMLESHVGRHRSMAHAQMAGVRWKEWSGTTR